METILQEHNNTMPASEVLVGLADKFRYVIILLSLSIQKYVCFFMYVLMYVSNFFPLFVGKH